MTRPGISSPATPFRPGVGSNVRIVPRTAKRWNWITASSMRTSSWLPVTSAGLYLIEMPSAVTVTTSGTTISSDCTERLQRPGSSTRTLPDSSPNTSTPRSNVPRMPSRSTVTPLRCCGVGGAPGAGGVLWAFWPKARLARSTPMAMVRISRPSLNPTSARPTVGPCSSSGPRVIGPPVARSPAAAGSIVNVSVRATLRPPSTVAKLPARNVTVTTPVVNRAGRTGGAPGVVGVVLVVGGRGTARRK